MEDTKPDPASLAAPPAQQEVPLYGYGLPGGPPGSMPFPMMMQMPAAIAAQHQAVAAAAAVAASVPAGPIPGSGGGGKGKKGEGGTGKMKKAPDAPKRFKSAFIIFSAEKHREIKGKLIKEGKTEKTTDIAKKVSQAWRELTPDERKVWEDMAAKDKARFDVEKQMYQGPWKIAANKRTPKDPSAPKRPSSAFLAFSNKRRAELKKANPSASNADLSKMLSKTWKTCDEETRKEYTEAEAALRAKYKEDIAEWRRQHAEVKMAERKEREAMAMQQVELKNQLMGDAAKAGEMAGMPPAMIQFMMQAGGAGGEGGAQFGQFSVPPAMLSQWLAYSQQNAQAQGGALGLYGQGLPNQGEQSSSAPQLAGFGSRTEGGADDTPAPSIEQQMQGFQDPTLAAAMMAGPPAPKQEFEQSESV